MEISSRQIYESFIQGAYYVIENKETLNKINVFPVQDGDTGTNLSSMMRMIINKAEQKETVKKTLESFANASLFGARGNSGAIFAQYFRGLCEATKEEQKVSMKDYALACNQAAQYAYSAVDKPVEGTMITLMRVWGEVLFVLSHEKSNLNDIFEQAFETLEEALKKTKEQMNYLRKANVVDSGAMGFLCFVKGALFFSNKQMKPDKTKIISVKEVELPFTPHIHQTNSDYRYCTECFFENRMNGLSDQQVKEFLKEKGDSIVVAGNQLNTRVHVHTNEPMKVFAYLNEKGKILYQKVEDMHLQEAVATNQKAPIAIVTDSIADIPKDYIKEHQVHMIHLDILLGEKQYMDKLTVSPAKLLSLCEEEQKRPAFSQPNPQNLENLFDYLSTYYKSAIVLTVSEELSGTYQAFLKAAKKWENQPFPIDIINTRQNGGAQGILVEECVRLVEKGMTQEAVVADLHKLIEKTKILVQINQLDAMIQSGRLGNRLGKIVKKTGLKPIVTLDAKGKGTIYKVALSQTQSDKQMIRQMIKYWKEGKLKEYNLIHVENETGAKLLAAKIFAKTKMSPTYIMETSSILAVSAGKGAIAVSYATKKEDEL